MANFAIHCWGPSHGARSSIIAGIVLSSCVILVQFFFLDVVWSDLFDVLWAKLEVYKADGLGVWFYNLKRVQDSTPPKMRSIVLTALSFCAAVFAQSSAVDQYLSRQVPISKTNLLANIGPNGSRSHGALPGVVVASPSQVDPDYVYTWTRDAALVFKAIVEQYTRGEDNNLRSLIDAYVWSQTRLQQVSNPSGTVTTGGLGEPKFNIDLTAYTGSWGRPQRDGPPLRATALVGYANHLIAQSSTSYVTSKIWPVVKLDLDYTAAYWNATGFDLWEEVSSSSFFTTSVQYRALVEGATLAAALGRADDAKVYRTEAAKVLCFLQTYWNANGGYVTANTGGGRSGKDANVALASIHSFDVAAGCDAKTFQPCSDKALSNLKVYVDSFRQIYSINNGIASNAAVATGRYPEDVYYNGNPWYLTTAAVAEQLYDVLIVWDRQGSLEVTNISLAFFRQFSSSVSTGKYAKGSATYKSLTDSVRNFADGFIAVIAKYTPADGSLAEQYVRNTGTPLSARHLTWSYASVLTAAAARSGYVPESWGAKGAVVPTVCERGGGGAIGNTVPVTFKVQASTAWGENIYLTGSLDALNAWSPENAILMSSASYPTWSVTVNLPANTQFEYKYIRKGNGAITWQSDPNNVKTTPPTGGSITFNDNWR
ncbi:glucoamylase G2 [Agrocybe pediades]|nr:glucoamylase G2 [Agrocybe pediades]